MRSYKNYDIMTSEDVCGSNFMVPYFMAIDKEDHNKRINLGISLEDVSKMNKDEADEFIYETARGIINDMTEVEETESKPTNCNFDEEGHHKDSESSQVSYDNNAELTTESTVSIPKPLTMEEDPFSEFSKKQMSMLVSQSNESVQIMESLWTDRAKQFKLNDDLMKQLYQFNEQHMFKLPEDISEEEKEKFDHLNGLDHFKHTDAVNIFGSNHPMVGPTDEICRDLAKAAMKDMLGYVLALREYRDINKAYVQYLEIGEMQKIHELEEIMEAEQDPEKKSKMKSSIDSYYYNKYLDFIAEPLDEKTLKTLSDAWDDEKKVRYWLERSKDKLERLKISPKFIADITNFEKRFLPEEYHDIRNMLLIYFINKVTFNDMGNPKNIERTRVVTFVIAMNNIIDNIATDDTKEKILNNIMTFLDQFINKEEGN